MSLELTWSPNGRIGNASITVESDGKTVFVDSFNVLKHEQRQRFLRKTLETMPELDAIEFEQKLLTIASQVNRQDEPDQQSEEVELGLVVRPELFHLPEVSGVAVPSTVRVYGDKGVEIRGRWNLILRHHADGKRERAPLDESLQLPDAEPIWFHPRPSEPAPQTAAGWSSDSRRAWLQGQPASSPADVFKRLCEAVANFIEFPADEAAGNCATMATWSMFTYCYPAWPAVPYLYFGGATGSGKSRCFEVLERVVFRPLATSNISGAALFRTLHDRGGTVLFDEAEQLKRSNDPGVGELLSMLLAGYKKGGRALRLEKVGDGFQTASFDVFGPKCLACVNGLPPALASRAIVVPMFRAAADSPKPKRRIDAQPDRWRTLRDDLHAMALEYGPTWPELAQRTDVCPSMSGRDFELWQPLLAIAIWLEEHGVNGLHQLLSKHAKRCIDAGRDDGVPDADAILLRIAYRAVRDFDHLTAKEILGRAQEAEPNSFSRWTAKAVGVHLRRYGIKADKSHGRRLFRPEVAEVERIATTYGVDLEGE